VRLPGLSPQAAEGANFKLAIWVTGVNPPADKKSTHLSLNPEREMP